MNKKFILILVCVLFVSSGCFSSTPKKSSSASHSVNATGKIIKEKEFKEGGKLAILPFKAGVNAVASIQLDRVSMMVVKGMVDYLAQGNTPFTVLTTQDQGDPDFVIDGYINAFIQPGKVKRWVTHNKKTILSVEGYMENPVTKERILIVQHKRSIIDRNKDGLDLAYQTGQDLGRFLVDSLQE